MKQNRLIPNLQGGAPINIQGNQIKSKAQPTENQPWAIGWLALSPAAWVAYSFLCQPGWPSTETAVRGDDG